MLTGKTIIVTGSASGIGNETARQIRALGGTVLGVDIASASPNADRHFQADLSSKASIDRLLADLPEGADGLANIAGLPPTAPADRLLLVNLVGLKYLTGAIAPRLARGASIVNVASLAGSGWADSLETVRAADELTFDNVAEFVARHDVGARDARDYFFSKEVLIVWTMQNRWKWRERDIRMNAVSPGPVETPIFEDFKSTMGARDSLDRRIIERVGTVGDVAPVICFLLSEHSAWIRGANIPVDGGMHAHLLGKKYGF
jgi:NAD(P)-dependent dehydrogenase (short-subunit alcohol dehydrogenase family)